MRGLRLVFTITLLLGGLFSPSAAGAQQATKVARIGYLSVNLAAAPPNQLEAFRQGLRDLGYVEGREVRACAESQDCQSAWPGDPTVAAVASGPGDPVTRLSYSSRVWLVPNKPFHLTPASLPSVAPAPQVNGSVGQTITGS